MELTALKAACSSCNLRELCLPVGLPPERLDALDALVYARRRLRRGERLFGAGDAFGSLYAVRSGFFKTLAATADGREQVTGFHMTGELLGVDGIGTDRHACDAVALEDSEVCAIPLSRLEDLSRRFEELQHHFHRVMSRALVHEQGVMVLLGSQRAEERLAAFLLDLARRFAARGYSSSEFVLRMTRGEIGSYLGLTLETVSRLFTRLQRQGLLEVRQKQVRIADASRLEKLAGRAC